MLNNKQAQKKMLNNKQKGQKGIQKRCTTISHQVINIEA